MAFTGVEEERDLDLPLRATFAGTRRRRAGRRGAAPRAAVVAAPHAAMLLPLSPLDAYSALLQTTFGTSKSQSYQACRLAVR